ncbi:unnamed protein product [Danaus chrysippus]|uniref:(African queen) hypothetical protein n=1 Tax=Danaus chrysippus TaxID=151541 RepID=A0A8J2R2B6_9NEOP|nr:unnamed protein product [Danaus chrysippus]
MNVTIAVAKGQARAPRAPVQSAAACDGSNTCVQSERVFSYTMNSQELEDERIRLVLMQSDSEDDLLSDGSEKEDHLSARSQDSDTEQNASSDGEENVPLSELQHQNPHGTKWSKNPPYQQVRTRSENIIRQTPGVSPAARSAQSELECWSVFCPDTMLSVMLTHTNSQIRERNSASEAIPHYRKEMDMSELKAFFGLLYIAGFYRSGRQNTIDLWVPDGTEVEIFRLTKPRQRFHFIQSCLRFDDKSTREERKLFDNLAPIRQVFDIFVENCRKVYILDAYVTIDEMLLAFRGRCQFRQYIPSKPAKYGIKILALADAKSLYIFNLEIYAGKQPEGPFFVSNKPFDVVNRLVFPISKTGRNVTFDNWFTSYELISHLLNEHKLTSVGTVRKNKRQLPTSFINTRGAAIFSSKFGFQKDITLVSHIPKKTRLSY